MILGLNYSPRVDFLKLYGDLNLSVLLVFVSNSVYLLCVLETSSLR